MAQRARHAGSVAQDAPLDCPLPRHTQFKLIVKIHNRQLQFNTENSGVAMLYIVGFIVAVFFLSSSHMLSDYNLGLFFVVGVAVLLIMSGGKGAKK